MSLKTGLVFLVAVVLSVVGCSKKEKTETADAKKTQSSSMDQATNQTRNPSEPDYVVVQHILIGFNGSIPGKNITRNQEEAEQLADSVFERAKNGEDFDELVEQYTDDSAPGIYKMANFGVEANVAQQIYARAQMVKAFGDVGFSLDVGEIGMAEYDPQTSRYGWHIIKRIE